jgi:hypothetical protein
MKLQLFTGSTAVAQHPSKPHISRRPATHTCLTNCMAGSDKGDSTRSTLTCWCGDVAPAFRRNSEASSKSLAQARARLAFGRDGAAGFKHQGGQAALACQAQGAVHQAGVAGAGCSGFVPLALRAC